MLNWSLLQSILIISMACSSVAVIFIQKTKRFCNNSKHVPIYSLIVNIILGFLFSQSFSDISYVNSVWAGLFSFLGADTIYKSLEGKLDSYTDLIQYKEDSSNTIASNSNNTSISNTDNNDIIGEINYE